MLNPVSWRLLAVMAMLALTVPRMWQRGMFLDGVTYAAVARNMAEGAGSFWAPFFSRTLYPRFTEQPPLALGLEALAFVLAGDHPAVERVHALAVFLANGAVIAALARRLLPAWCDWVPVLLWLTPAVVTWSAVNNMLEQTQALFTSLACYGVLRTAGPCTSRASAGWAAFAGGAVAAAVLAKGPVGLFPLALPLLLLAAPPGARPAHAAIVWPAFYATVLVAATLVLLSEPSRHAIDAYVRSHLAPSLAGDRGAGSRAADLLRHLGVGIGSRLALLVVVARVALRRRRFPHQDIAPFLFAIALAASVPIAASPLIAGHYFVPSTAFFALGAAALVGPGAAARPAPRRWRALPGGLAGGLAAAIVLTLSVHGAVEVRDRDLLRSLDAIRPLVRGGETVGACPASATHWGLQAYLQRFHRISVRADGTGGDQWFVLVHGACEPPPGCLSATETAAFSWLRCDAGRPAGAVPPVHPVRPPESQPNP
jgi:4-amino-4-deoxy-L-arabinose transferase-like glycosyltransferase